VLERDIQYKTIRMSSPNITFFVLLKCKTFRMFPICHFLIFDIEQAFTKKDSRLFKIMFCRSYWLPYWRYMLKEVCLTSLENY